MIGELEAAAADWLRNVVKHRDKPHPAVGTPCANCETPLQGLYCYHCGQSSDDHKRSIAHLFWEALESLFHVDGRLWRTMPALFFRPGRLANDYIEGRAARHVPPFRTFLVALLLFIFAAEHAIHEIREHEAVKAQAHAARLKTPQGRAAEAARLRANAAENRTDSLKEATEERTGDLKEADNAAEKSRIETRYRAALASAQKHYDRSLAKAELVAQGKPVDTPEIPGATEESRKELAAKIRAADDGPATPGHAQVKAAGKKSNWLKEGMAKALENPDYYLTVMFGWAHRIAVLLLPIVGLSLAAVNFYKRKFYLYDHLLVAMNLLSFAFLTNALGLVLPMQAWPFWFAMLVFWTPINLFQTLRGAYHSSVIGALVKTVVVWSATFIAFTTLLVVLLIFTLSQV